MIRRILKGESGTQNIQIIKLQSAFQLIVNCSSTIYTGD